MESVMVYAAHSQDNHGEGSLAEEGKNGEIKVMDLLTDG